MKLKSEIKFSIVTLTLAPALFLTVTGATILSPELSNEVMYFCDATADNEVVEAFALNSTS